jgi:hypothetical protein
MREGTNAFPPPLGGLAAGDRHNGEGLRPPPAKDAGCDAWIMGQGIMALRFRSQEIVSDLEDVVTAIRRCAVAPAPLNLLPQGEGESDLTALHGNRVLCNPLSQGERENDSGVCDVR